MSLGGPFLLGNFKSQLQEWTLCAGISWVLHIVEVAAAASKSDSETKAEQNRRKRFVCAHFQNGLPILALHFWSVSASGCNHTITHFPQSQIKPYGLTYHFAVTVCFPDFWKGGEGWVAVGKCTPSLCNKVNFYHIVHTGQKYRNGQTSILLPAS